MTDKYAGATPGPWWYQEQSDAYTHIVRASENRFVCQLLQDRSGKAEADARLIADAPALAAENAELRAALDGLWKECVLAGHDKDTDFGWPRVMEAARAALSRKDPGR